MVKTPKKYAILIKEDVFHKPDSNESDSNKPRFIFLVVDLNLGNHYPENYVCAFPISLNGSVFEKFVGNREQTKTLAKELLGNLKAKTTKPEILKEIDRQLKLMQPKRPTDRKCVACGVTFTPTCPKNTKYCSECGIKKKKSYSAWVYRNRKNRMG